MTISPEAVQAALDAWDNASETGAVPDEQAMQAALEAAFPIMLRELAIDVRSELAAHSDKMPVVHEIIEAVAVMLDETADTYGKEDV